MNSLRIPILAVVTLLSSPLHGKIPSFAASDLVLGASDFDTPGTGQATASTIDGAIGIAVDPTTGKVFVGDLNRNRILRFPDFHTLTSGAAAEAVLGQPDFTQSSPATTQTGLKTVFAISIDTQGRLWVADFDNHRVVMYENAAGLASGSPADLVLGQPDFTTGTPGTSDVKMDSPSAVHVDDQDNLWVADYDNHRVLKFASVSSLSNGAAASVILGQPGFGTQDPLTTRSGMLSPAGVFIDSLGNLWVGDEGNNRVLRFANAASLTNGAEATAVLGQSDFTTSAFGTSASSLSGPNALLVDAGGTLRVIDMRNHRIVFFRNAASRANGAAADGFLGQPDLVSGNPGTTARMFDTPGYGITMDPDGALWISDTGNKRVLRFSADRTAPLLRLRSRVPRVSAAPRLTLAGTASDPAGIERVFARSGKRTLTARGTTRWRLKVKLNPGGNRLRIQAVDGVRNTSAARTVRVRRK